MIDTEGYELFVLKGGIETIKKYKPILVVEFSYAKQYRPVLTQKFGYKLQTLRKFIIEELGYKFIYKINKVDKVFAPICINNLHY